MPDINAKLTTSQSIKGRVNTRDEIVVSKFYELPPGTALSLNGLNDVNVVSPASGSFLAYDSSNSQWVDTTAVQIVGSSVNISGNLAVGTITAGLWNGTAIADAYISSAATWNGKQNALTFGIADTNSLVADGTPVSGEFAQFTSDGLVSRTDAEVRSDIGLGSLATLNSLAFVDLTSTPTTIAGYGITDAFDGATSSLTGDIDLTSQVTGILPVANMAATALTTVQTAASQVAQLALVTEEGDVVVRSDELKTYMHNGGSAGTMADFTLLATPTDSVTSVDGSTGAVTTLQLGTSSTTALAGDTVIPDVSNFITASSNETLTNKSIDATQLTNTIDNARLPSAATNITSVGTLTNLVIQPPVGSTGGILVNSEGGSASFLLAGVGSVGDADYVAPGNFYVLGAANTFITSASTSLIGTTVILDTRNVEFKGSGYSSDLTSSIKPDNTNSSSSWKLTDKVFNINSASSAPTAMWLGDSGTKLYIIGSTNDDIDRFELTTPYDISSNIIATTSNDTGNGSVPQGMYFKSDGTRYWTVDSGPDYIRQYSLSTAWDIQTASRSTNTLNGKAYVNIRDNGDASPTGVAFSADGLKVIVCGVSGAGSTGDSIFSYTLGTAFDIFTMVGMDGNNVAPSPDVRVQFSSFTDLRDEISLPHDIFFLPDGLTLYVVCRDRDDIVTFTLGTAFDITTMTYNGHLSIDDIDGTVGALYVDPVNNIGLMIGQESDNVYQWTVDNNALIVDAQSTQFKGQLGVYDDLTVDGDVKISGKSFYKGALISSGTTTTLGNTILGNATGVYVRMGHTSGTGTLDLGRSIKSQIINLHGGVTESGETKTLNIGTGGASGSTTNITIGTATAGATQTTTVNGELTVNSDTLKLTSTTASSTTENPSIELFRNGGSAAAGAELGAIKFFGTNNASTPEKIEYAGIYAETEYHVDGSEQGNIKFKLSHGGAQEDPVMSLFSYGMQMGYGNPILMSYSNGYQQFFSENAVQKSFKFQAFPNATVANGAYNIYLPDVAGGTLAVIDSDKAFTAGATTVNGALTVNSDLLEITSTVDDATEKPIISLYRDAGVPSPNDELGAIRWFGQNASDEKQFYGGIYAQADVITDGAHKGSLNFHLADGSNNGTAISDVLVDINGDEDPTMNLTAELLTLNAGLIVNNDFMEVVSTTDSANDMPILSLYRDAGATTNGDEIGGVRFFGNNASDEKTFYCGMYAEIKEGDDGGEIGELMFHVADNSGNTSAVTDVTANIVGDTDPAMSLLYYQLNLRSDVNLNFQYGAGNYNYVNWDTGSNNTKLVADYSDDANITCTLPVATCTLSGEGLNQSSYRSGEIIETLRGYADGRTLTGQATTAGAARNVALEDVTAEQILSNSYAKVNGTEFDYYPPAGTKTVLVEYQIFIGYDGSDIDPVFHHKIDVDGTVITQTQSTTRQEYRGHVYSVSEAIITVDGSGDLASGNIDSWNAAKTFRVLGREFGASNNVALHRVRIHDGSASATIINEPKIKITAIG